MRGDFVYEWDDMYERALETDTYTKKGDGIILL